MLTIQKTPRTNSDSAKTPLSFFLSTVGAAYREPKQDAPIIRPDWAPQAMTRVLYQATDGQWLSATYVGRWNEVRKNQWTAERLVNDTSYEASPYLEECLPYCENLGKEEVVRAYIINDHDMLGDYIDIGLIIPASLKNIEWAFAQNNKRTAA